MTIKRESLYECYFKIKITLESALRKDNLTNYRRKEFEDADIANERLKILWDFLLEKQQKEPVDCRESERIDA